MTGGEGARGRPPRPPVACQGRTFHTEHKVWQACGLTASVEVAYSEKRRLGRDVRRRFCDHHLRAFDARQDVVVWERRDVTRHR